MSAPRRLVLAFPGDLQTRTGGYLYDRRLALELEARGWTVERLSLPDSFPYPTTAALAETARCLAAVPDGTTVLVDGLALGAMPDVAVAAASRLDLVGLVHHPLCLESGLTVSQARALEMSERLALAVVRAVIVTSPSTGRTLSEVMDVDAARIVVALPGTDPAPLAPGSSDGTVRMLSVGSVIPRKGHRLLIEALADVQGGWQLAIGGSLDREPVTVAELRAVIATVGLGDRVVLLDELSASALSTRYDEADLFVSASFYEGYGMALTEALARGLPIVATAGGAVAETVPAAAALLVPPGDMPALREALRCCVGDRAVLDRLRQGAIAAREGLPTWDDAAARVETALMSVAP